MAAIAYALNKLHMLHVSVFLHMLHATHINQASRTHICLGVFALDCKFRFANSVYSHLAMPMTYWIYKIEIHIFAFEHLNTRTYTHGRVCNSNYNYVSTHPHRHSKHRATWQGNNSQISPLCQIYCICCLCYKLFWTVVSGQAFNVRLVKGLRSKRSDR